MLVVGAVCRKAPGGEGKWLCLRETKVAAALDVSGMMETEPRLLKISDSDQVLKMVWGRETEIGG